MIKLKFYVGSKLQKWGNLSENVWLRLGKDEIGKIYRATEGIVYFGQVKDDEYHLEYHGEYAWEDLRIFVRNLLKKKVEGAIEKQETTLVDGVVTVEDILAISNKVKEIRKQIELEKQRAEYKRKVEKELSDLVNKKRHVIPDWHPHWANCTLIDGTQIKTYTLEDKERAIKFLKDLDDRAVLKNLLDQKTKKIEELKNRIDELEMKIEEIEIKDS